MVRYHGLMDELLPRYEPYEPYAHHYFDVADGIRIHVAESGNPDGRPILLNHGGPGAGISQKHRGIVSPEKFRVIQIDQRGCGESTPFGHLEHNTTPELLSDVELVRNELGIDSWIVGGGSWGSTMSLLYAINNPDRVEYLLVWGIFLARRSEIDWLYEFGASELFPEQFEIYREGAQAQSGESLLSAYRRQIDSDNDTIARKAAITVAQWEESILCFDEVAANTEPTNEMETLSVGRLETWYMTNGCFIATDNYILENADAFSNIDGTIVNGRYDVICPVRSAYDLHLAWPKANYTITTYAGHSTGDKGITSALRQVTDAL